MVPLNLENPYFLVMGNPRKGPPHLGKPLLLENLGWLRFSISFDKGHLCLHHLLCGTLHKNQRFPLEVYGPLQGPRVKLFGKYEEVF